MRLIAIGLVCLVPGIAFADNTTKVAASEPPPPPNTAVTPADPPAPPPDAGTRLRNGFSASIGEETGSGPSSGLSGQLYGVDWRIGAHLPGAFSVYADTHLSLGTANIGAASGYTGNFAFAVVGEAELPARTFVAAGAGYGVLNNPSGPLAQARVGWYPFDHDATPGRRLDVALDARFYFAGDAIGTVSQIALTIGYDHF